MDILSYVALIVCLIACVYAIAVSNECNRIKREIEETKEFEWERDKVITELEVQKIREAALQHKIDQMKQEITEEVIQLVKEYFSLKDK